MKAKDEIIKCCKCGKMHEKTTCNCCWIDCECGTKICGNCGSDNIGSIKMSDDDEDAQYWCCNQCNDCGLRGCAMCI